MKCIKRPRTSLPGNSTVRRNTVRPFCAGGYEILAGYPEKFEVSTEFDGSALPVYGKDYRLGDVCSVVDEELGVELPLRLTQVDWVSENGTTSVYPVFGT